MQVPLGETSLALTLVFGAWNAYLSNQARHTTIAETTLTRERAEFQRIIAKQDQLDVKTEKLVGGLERDVERLRTWVDAAELRAGRSSDCVQELKSALELLEKRILEQAFELTSQEALRAENLRLRHDLAEMTTQVNVLQARLNELERSASFNHATV